MRRSKDNKRVLRSGNGRTNKKSRRIPRTNRKLISRNKNPYPPKRKKKKKASGKVVFLMILALVAFVIGAGAGIALSFEEDVDEGPHFENVTKEMTTNLNDTEPIYYDEDVDAIDFNENQTSQLNVEYAYTYN